MNRNSPKAPEYTSELCKECVHFLGFYFLYINFIWLKKHRGILFIQLLVEVVNFNNRKVARERQTYFIEFLDKLLVYWVKVNSKGGWWSIWKVFENKPNTEYE